MSHTWWLWIIFAVLSADNSWKRNLLNIFQIISKGTFFFSFVSDLFPSIGNRYFGRYLISFQEFFHHWMHQLFVTIISIFLYICTLHKKQYFPQNGSHRYKLHTTYYIFKSGIKPPLVHFARIRLLHWFLLLRFSVYCILAIVVLKVQVGNCSLQSTS